MLQSPLILLIDDGLRGVGQLSSPCYQPETAVIVVLTRLANQYLLEAALKNGAQAAFYKPMVTGDLLDKAILKVISTVSKDRK